MTSDRHEIDDSAEAWLSEWRAPYVAFCHDLDALRDVNVRDPTAMAEAIVRLRRIGKVFDEFVSWAADGAIFKDLYGIPAEDARAVLSLFEKTLARLEMVEGTDFSATTAALVACRGLAACMAEFMRIVYG